MIDFSLFTIHIYLMFLLNILPCTCATVHQVCDMPWFFKRLLPATSVLTKEGEDRGPIEEAEFEDQQAASFATNPSSTNKNLIHPNSIRVCPLRQAPLQSKYGGPFYERVAVIVFNVIL